MKFSLPTLGGAVFLVVTLAVYLLRYTGFEHAPFTVLVSGLLAGGAVAVIG